MRHLLVVCSMLAISQFVFADVVQIEDPSRVTVTYVEQPTLSGKLFGGDIVVVIGFAEPTMIESCKNKRQSIASSIVGKLNETLRSAKADGKMVAISTLRLLQSCSQSIQLTNLDIDRVH